MRFLKESSGGGRKSVRIYMWTPEWRYDCLVSAGNSYNYGELRGTIGISWVVVTRKSRKSRKFIVYTFGYIFDSQVDGWKWEELVGVISLLLGLGCSEYLYVVVSYCRLQWASVGSSELLSAVFCCLVRCRSSDCGPASRLSAGSENVKSSWCYETRLYL